MTVGINGINARIHSDISPDITLTKDEGYHTLTFDNGPGFGERTVMVPYTSDFTLTRWLAEARDFAAEMGL